MVVHELSNLELISELMGCETTVSVFSLDANSNGVMMKIIVFHHGVSGESQTTTNDDK